MVITYVEAYYLASTEKGQEKSKYAVAWFTYTFYVKQYNISYK